MWYTRRGDGGTSGLFGTKERLPKDHPVYHALGTLDELNSWLGICKARSNEPAVQQALAAVQENVFIMQAELAGADKHLTEETLTELEANIEELERALPAPHSFLVPGANVESAYLDYARAVCRRAERAVVTAATHQALSPQTCAYSNRLSSYLYALARNAAQKNGVEEHAPSY